MKLINATNHILGVLGEATVTTTQIQHPTVASILETIDMEKDSFLENGLWFNTREVKMYPNESGAIEVPTNALFIRDIEKDNNLYVERSGGLYDVTADSSVFTEPVDLEIIYNLDFEDLPESVARAIMYNAAYIKYVSEFGVDNTAKQEQQFALKAEASVKKQNLKSRKYNSNRNKSFYRITSFIKG